MAKVLIYAMNYAPEVAGVGHYTGEIGEEFVAMGHAVTVVTTVPHYPGWKVTAPYRNGRYSVETLGGARIIRCPLILRQRMVGIWRLLAPLSFAVSSAPIALWQILRHRPDVVLCIEPTLMVAPVAVLAARLIGARTVLHVQDLEVDACFAVGHLSHIAWLEALASRLERRILAGFDRLITISAPMAERLVAKGVPAERIAIVRNWVDLDHIKPLERVSPYRAELGLSDSDRVALYSGNIGAKQGLGDVIAAARRLAARADLKFLIAGEGPAKAALEAEAAGLANVRFLPFQPYERLSDFLGLADVHILPQAADAADLVLPSKLGGMLASGRRIVVTAAPETELATFLAGAAFVVPPGDAAALAAAIEQAVDSAPEESRAARRRSLAESLSKPDCLSDFRAFVMREAATWTGQGGASGGGPDGVEGPREALG
ncbi:MAG: WcaI family glycosyltransferase [Roseiarcus sp.]|jgi:colanic acid biosynthesis glycosyl transferase WcaI